MAEKITGIELNGKLYSFYSLGMPVYEELGITLERFAELLGRDAYCPTLKSEPTSTDLVYTDTDGSINHFSVGQLCRWEESGLYRFAICRNITDNEVSWYILPSKVSELTNDAGYLTEHQDISGKVDKVDGKGLSTNDYTTTEKNKLAGIASGAEVNVQSDWNVTDTTSDAYIKNKPTIPSAVSESTVSGWGFTKNTGTITGIKMNGASKGSSGVVDLGTVITSHQDISGKVDKVDGKGLSTNDYTTTEKNKLAGIASGAEVNVQSDWSVTDSTSDAYIKNKPTIPSAVSESTVSGWGFTKNTGTITGIKMNGATKGSSGVVDLGTVITSHQDISGKLDAATAASTYATKTALSQLQTQLNTIVGGDSSSAIESFNEIVAFLENVTDTQTLDGIIAGINTEIAKKAGKSDAITSISRSGTTFTATRADGTTFTFSQQDNNTTYTFAGGTNQFTVTPLGGTAQTVTVTPSISNNVTYSGTLTSGQVAVLDGTAGKVKASGYTIAKSVPSDAKFSDTTYSAATTSAAGLMSASDKSKLDGIASGANNYSLPTASSTLGGVKTTSTVTSTSGLTATPIIDGVPYYKNTTYTSLKNPNALTVKYNDTSSYTYDGSAAKTLNIKPGSNVSVTGDTSGNITINATDTTYSAATTSAAGLMSASDKSKLDGIASGANKYSLPTASSTLGGVKTTSTVTSTSGLTATPIIDGVPYYKDTTYTSLKNPNALTVQYNGTSSYTYDGSAAKTLNIKPGSNVTVTGDTSGNITIAATNTTYSAATTSAAGLMSASDKSKLDGIASGANKYSLPLAASGTRGGIQIGYTASGANVPVALSSEKAYVALTKTAVTSALGYTPPTTNTTYSSGTGLSLSGTTFSLATSGATAGSYGPSAAVTGSEGTTMNIPYITVDTYGRVTSISNKVYTAKNTTYSSMSESEANTGTAGTGRLVTAKVLHNKINKVLSDGIFVNYAGEYVVDKTYPAGAWVKFGGGDYIAKKSTSLPPIAIAALSSTALALVSTNTYALMGGYEEYGNKDDWFEINPASGSIKRISASVTLAKGDQKVICSNSSAITVKLPLAPHDGCEIWIAARSGNVTVSPSSGDSLLGGNKTLTSTSGWGVYIYDVQNATWLFK